MWVFKVKGQGHLDLKDCLHLVPCEQGIAWTAGPNFLNPSVYITCTYRKGKKPISFHSNVISKTLSPHFMKYYRVGLAKWLACQPLTR